MPDALGRRKKFACIGPSTNTIVQPDFDDLRPHGVTNHYSRIEIPNLPVSDDASFLRLVEAINKATVKAVESVLTCGPDYFVMGMSASTFWDGRKGAETFKAMIESAAGMGVSCGSLAAEAALRRYPQVRRIAFLSPYYPVANAQVRRFFEDCGFTVVRDTCLRCKSPQLIAHVQEDECRRALMAIDGDDVDALVQVGTNLSMIRLAAAAERWLAKPVIAINTATYWHALRVSGIADKIYGFGSLLENH